MQSDKYHNLDLTKSTFLVTGGAGFIGSHITKYLLNHNAKKVFVLDNFSTGFKKNIEDCLKKKNFKLINGDIRDYKICLKAMKGVDYVLHQAALGSVPRSIQDPLTVNEVNISGFLNVLIAAKESKTVNRTIYAASSSTYGDSTSLPKKEDIIGKSLSPYAVTKYVNELYADVFYKTYGVETIGLRYFNVFGPFQNPKGDYAAVIPRFITRALKGKNITINGDGNHSRDFTYIDNVVQANIKAIFTKNKQTINQVYNVACGKKISLSDLVLVLKKELQLPIKVVYGPERKGDVKHSLADISKAKKSLGYDPKISFSQGIKNTLSWYLSKED